MSAFTTYSARAEGATVLLRYDSAANLNIAIPADSEDRHAGPISGDMLRVMKRERMNAARRRLARARLIEKSEGCIG